MDPRTAEPAWLLPLEAACVERAVEKRRREFAAGRTMARSLLRELGVGGDAALLPGPRREPQWPESVVGSISHTETWAGVVLAHRSDCAGLGLDVELATPLKDEIARRICVEDELAWLEASWPDPVERGRWGKLVFSAKETAYKAQYPHSQTFLGFDAMSIAVDVAAETFVATFLVEALPFRVGETFEGRFALRPDLIATGICLPAGVVKASEIFGDERANGAADRVERQVDPLQGRQA